MDNLPFLESEEPEAIEQPEPEAVEVVEPVDEAKPERDERGRFAPKPEDKPEPVMVPLAALQETRDKVRDLEARLAAQPQPPQGPEMPDIFDDQQGYTNAIQQQVQDAIYQERLNFSHRLAEQSHGKETVEAALEWGRQKCNDDPNFNAAVKSNPDPVGFAVEQYRREQIASQVDLGEFEKFKAWQAAQAQAQQPTPIVEQPQPPRSIASLPSSGGVAHVPVGPGQAFDSLFTR